MYPLAWEVRGTECMKYCETRENCAFACGLEPLVSMEENTAPIVEEDHNTYPLRFVLVPKKFRSPEESPVYSK